MIKCDKCGNTEPMALDQKSSPDHVDWRCKVCGYEWVDRF